MDQGLKAVVLVCTLKTSDSSSSSEKLGSEVLAELNKSGISGELIRVADYNVLPGVQIDIGEADQWPEIRQKIVDAQVLILATPIWLGHPSSVTQKVLERLDAELSEKNDDGLPSMYNKVAGVAVVGNEDGAHNVCADVFQALNDIGFTIPAAASTYWVGEAKGSVDYKDLSKSPKVTSETTERMAKNVSYLAKILNINPYL